MSKIVSEVHDYTAPDQSTCILPLALISDDDATDICSSRLPEVK
jgi:hypothetical protein